MSLVARAPAAPAMRKNVSAFLVFLFIAMAFSFVGCKKQASTTSSAAKTPVASAPATTAQPVAKASEPTKQADVKAIVFRVGHKSSANSSWQKGAEYWGKLLEEKSNGTMKIEVYPNSQLGDQKEMTEMAQLGVLDVVLNAPATLSNFMDLIFKDKKDFLRVKNSNTLTQQAVGKAYGISSKMVDIVYYDIVNSIKITIPRRTISGNIDDDDVYGCQQQLPLANILIP